MIKIPHSNLRPHGGPDLRELAARGLRLEDIVDLSQNTNPYGPAPAVVEAASSARLDIYPDSTARAFREAAAERHGFSPEEFVLGNGAAELIWNLARLFAGPGRTGLISGPAFSEYTAAIEAAGGEVIECRAEAREDFAVRLELLAERIEIRSPSLLFLCSPNNPTGQRVALEKFLALADRFPETLFVLDQVFVTLSDHADEEPVIRENVVFLRSLTKDHAIPGLRAGYLVAPRKIAEAIEAARPSWSTSAPAQAAAVAALRESAFVEDSRKKMLADRDRMLACVRATGFRAVPTSSHFFLIEVGDAHEMRERLLARGLIVRDCSSFGLPGFIRVCAAPEKDSARFLAALAGEKP